MGQMLVFVKTNRFINQQLPALNFISYQDVPFRNRMLHFSRLEVGVTDANNPDDVIAWTLVQQIPLVQVSDGNLRLNRTKFIIKVFYPLCHWVHLP